jgi:hypothetical protein
MKNYLTNATKRRVIREIKKILYDHPRYRADSENVQNKFSFSERPNRGVVINGTSADRVRLSADNYVGRHSSFVMLTPVENFPCTSIEWVVENVNELSKISPRRDIFPSAPGVYRVKVLDLPDEAHNTPGHFTVDTILTVHNEPLIVFQSSADQDAQISHENIYQGSLRLWLDNRIALIPDVDYSIDYVSGYVTFLKSTPAGESITADYRYASPNTGNFPFYREHSDVDAIPGVVLAFGDRVQQFDQIDIVVTDERVHTMDVYGGKFEINFELLAFTKDSDDREKMSDYIIVKILEIQNSLGFEGIELLDVSPGGENEEVYNAETDDYFYDSTISLSFRVDWEIYVPLPVVVQRAELTSLQAEQENGHLTTNYPNDLVGLGNPSSANGVSVVIGKGVSFERTS